MRMHFPTALSPGHTPRAIDEFTEHDRRAAIVGVGQAASLDDADAEDLEELRRRGRRETATGRPTAGGPSRPGTAIGGTLNPVNGMLLIAVAISISGNWRMRSSASRVHPRVSP